MEKLSFNLPKLKKDDPILSEFFERVIQDADVKQFIQKFDLNHDFVFEHLALFMRFIEENQPCKQCPGFIACIKEPKGYDTILSFGESELEIVYRKCEKNRLQQQVMTDYLYHDFDESWLDERLDSVTVNPERRVLVVNLMNIIKDEGTQYFYIHSHRAVGKSYIAAMLSNEVVFSLHKKAAFVNAKRLLERLRATVIEKKQEYDDMLTNLETVSLLVIDDIGSEKVTDLSIEIITSLIDTRLKNNRATILTSNYSLRELESMYSAHQLKAKRLISRLTGSFQEVYLDGLDYRKVR